MKTIRNVYSEDIMEQLEGEAGLCTSVALGMDNIGDYADLARSADYAFSTWGMPAFSKEFIEKYFPNLKVVFYAAGSVQGFARPFLEAGIRVFSGWGANGIPVAEYTVSQILLANKGFFLGCYYQSSGRTREAREHCSKVPGNYGCKVGIIGAGMIGTLVIKMLKAFHNLEILVFDPFLSDERAAALGVEKCSLQRLFSECITISNHLASNPQTVGILNGSLFSLMQDRATFINTGRGAQVVEEDLAVFLATHPTVTAVLDVTEPEPPPEGHPFYRLPNVFLTPHIAGSLGSEVTRMAQFMLEEFRHLHCGQPVSYEVTFDMLSTMA